MSDSQNAWKNASKFVYSGWDKTWGFPRLFDNGWKFRPGQTTQGDFTHLMRNASEQEVVAFGPKEEVLTELKALLKTENPLSHPRVIKRNDKDRSPWVEEKDGNLFVAMRGLDLILKDATEEFKHVLSDVLKNGNQLDIAKEMVALKARVEHLQKSSAEKDAAIIELTKENAELKEKRGGRAAARL